MYSRTICVVKLFLCNKPLDYRPDLWYNRTYDDTDKANPPSRDLCNYCIWSFVLLLFVCDATMMIPIVFYRKDALQVLRYTSMQAVEVGNFWVQARANESDLGTMKLNGWWFEKIT